jgi:hypothetical protein
VVVNVDCLHRSIRIDDRERRADDVMPRGVDSDLWNECARCSRGLQRSVNEKVATSDDRVNLAYHLRSLATEEGLKTCGPDRLQPIQTSLAGTYDPARSAGFWDKGPMEATLGRHYASQRVESAPPRRARVASRGILLDQLSLWQGCGPTREERNGGLCGTSGFLSPPYSAQSCSLF